MANDDWIAARGGMLPLEHPYGAVRKNYYKLTTSATLAVFIGEPMDLDANGQCLAATAGTGGTNSTMLVGPAVGFADANLNALPNTMLSLTAGPSLPANTDGYILIADDPDQIFIMQVATDGTAITTANMMDNATWTYRTTSGSTTTGFSTAEISNLSLSITGSGNLQVLGLLPLKNSDASTNAVGNYAKVRVRIINHRFGGRYVLNTAI